MTPEHFKALVSSKRANDRRLAARAVAADPALVDRAVIEGAYYREMVPQIRQQFSVALETLDAKVQAAEPPAKQAKELFDQAHLKAVRTVTEQVLHQLNPLIGDVEMAASAEIKNFGASQTKVRIEQLKLQADAVRKLYIASQPAVFEEFDLATVIRNCLPNDLEHNRCRLDFAGQAPLMVQADRSLVAVAVTNGLRNAIEASVPVASTDHKPPIVVNWGATDRDCWISIIDEGVGFPGNVEGAFRIGMSTKGGHGGHGLPQVRAAMLSLSGSAELIPKDKGCTLNLNWPIIGMTK